MTETVHQLPEEPTPPSVAERYRLLQKAGGVVVPLLTVVLAFFVGGIVILLTTGSVANTFETYREIFEGSGLSWFFDVGSHSIGIPFTDAHVWFPWNTSEATSNAAANLQQTMILWVPLALTGLAVAFAFRCGLFNIGGQGQYLAGSIAAVLIATELPKAVDLPGIVLIVASIVGAMLVGAVLAGIAGFLKGTVGAHEVITTIMLNWIAIFVGMWLFGLGGPLQGGQESLPRSATIFESAQLWQIWGRIQALHAGLFIALFALIVYHLLLNRTTLGYEVRAVGFNPEAARYSGISISRNYFLAMGISGAFAGLAGGVDLTGWRHAIDVSDFSTNFIGFTGIAVALLGRNKAVGILFAALLFGALQVGTSSRQLDPSVFPPELGENLSTMIQAMVIFFVGAELLIVYIWQARRYLGLGRKPGPDAPVQTGSPE